MMESLEISQLLGSWGYDESVISRFKDEGIETSHLKNLTEYSIEKLFPKIGERTTFMTKIKTLYDQETPTKRRRMTCDTDTISVASDTTHLSTSSFTMTIEELMNDSGADGKMILSYFKTENILNNFYRQKLADLIVIFDLNIIDLIAK